MPPSSSSLPFIENETIYFLKIDSLKMHLIEFATAHTGFLLCRGQNCSQLYTFYAEKPSKRIIHWNVCMCVEFQCKHGREKYQASLKSWQDLVYNFFFHLLHAKSHWICKTNFIHHFQQWIWFPKQQQERRQKIPNISWLICALPLFHEKIKSIKKENFHSLLKFRCTYGVIWTEKLSSVKEKQDSLLESHAIIF